MAPARRKAFRKPKVHRRVDPDTIDPRAPRKGSAPRPYDAALAQELCERIACGETATKICREAKFPSWPVIMRWRREHKVFAKNYEEARQLQCQYWGDHLIDVANDGSQDTVLNAQGRPVFNRERFERSRLRVEAFKWTLSKVARHTYGDRTEHELSTPNGPLGVAVSERNALIDAICKLVEPKADGTNKPNSRKDEPRER